MHIFFDQAKQKWVIYRRVIPEFSERMIANDSDRNRAGVDRYNRSYAYAESDDLKEWKNHRFILAMDADDPADTELYQFACHKFGQTYVGYMSIFHLGDPQPIRHSISPLAGTESTSHASAGGHHSSPRVRWDTTTHGDGLLAAPSRSWSTTRSIFTTRRQLSSRCRYRAARFRVLNGRRRPGDVEARPIRLAGNEHPDPGPCRVITKPFMVRHPRLFLNAATWMKGSIRVEALTRDWQPIPGFAERQARTIQGDALDHPVRWNDNADLIKLLSQEIRLKFYMTRSRLHAMTASNEDRKLGTVDSQDQPDKLSDSTPKLN